MIIILILFQGGYETHSRGYSPIHYYEEVTENDGTRKEQVPLTVTETQVWLTLLFAT